MDDVSMLAELLNSIEDDDFTDKKIMRSLRQLQNLTNEESHSRPECLKNYSDRERRGGKSVLPFNSTTSGDSSEDLSLDLTQLLETVQKQILKLNETRVYMKDLIVHLIQSRSAESFSYSEILESDSLTRHLGVLKTETEIITSLGDFMRYHNELQQETNCLLTKLFSWMLTRSGLKVLPQRLHGTNWLRCDTQLASVVAV